MSENTDLRPQDASKGTAGDPRRPLLKGNTMKDALKRYAIALGISALLIVLILLLIGYFSDARTAQFAVDSGIVVGTEGPYTMAQEDAFFVLGGFIDGDTVLAALKKDAILELTRVRILADAFFAAGVLVFGIGGIIFVAQEGALDGLVYGVRQLGALFQLGRKWGVKHESYHEFKERMAARPKNKFGYLMIIGAAILLIALYFVLKFEKMTA